MPERNHNPESEHRFTKPIVLTCIDFRAVKPAEEWLGNFELKDGNYFLFASAGASGNPDGFLETVNANHHPAILVGDHQDCGYYKKNGDDSPDHHHHNLELLGQYLGSQNPDVNYQYRLIPIADTRHTAGAAAIILGNPQTVRVAKEILAGQNLSGNYDVIARPYELSTHDNTLWNDLGISLLLHKPQRIFIFDNDQANAQRLAQDAKIITPQTEIIPVVIKGLSQG